MKNILKKDRIETFLDSYDILKPMKKDWRQYGEGGKNRWVVLMINVIVNDQSYH